MIGAIKRENGKYTLIDISFHLRFISTFRIKEKIKNFGGRWDDKKKKWYDFPAEHLSEINASKRFKIRVCPFDGNDKPSDMFAFDFQIKNNKVQVLFRSDDREWVEIEEIYGEQ